MKNNFSKYLKGSLKVLSFNILFTVLLFVFSDIAIQTILYYKSIFNNNPNENYLFFKKINNMPNHLGFTELHPVLGYHLTSNFDEVINNSNWLKNSRLSTDNYGFRKNDNNLNLKKKALLLGDSFAFGSQVSNNETISSYLENKSMIQVDNAGAPGYGTAQAVKRGEIIVDMNFDYDIGILSILVNAGLNRSRHKYRGGYPKASIIKEGDSIKYAMPPNNLKGTLYESYKDLNTYDKIYRYLINWSYIVNKMISLKIIKVPFFKNELHSNAASKSEILDFLLDKFKNFDFKKHILLLQYDDQVINEPDKYNYERRLIKEKAFEKDIPVIDTFDKLRTYEKPIDLWLRNHGHHTPKGNKFISEQLNLYLKGLSVLNE